MRAGVMRISTLMLSLVSTFASIYVAGRLWQDSQNRVYLIGQWKSAIKVDDALKMIACREKQKKLSALELELSAARQEGFAAKRSIQKRPLLVIGVFTTFGGKKNRDAVRKSWMGTGSTLKALEEKKGIIARFVIGRSANQGDSLDREIDAENRLTKDFIILVGVLGLLMMLWRHLTRLQRRLNCSLLMLQKNGRPSSIIKQRVTFM